MHVSSNFSVLVDKYEESEIRITNIPKGLLRKYELLDGISRLSDWPSPLFTRYSDDWPEGIHLTESISNPFGWLLISDPFKKILEEINLNDVEYLPIGICDHQGNLVNDSYYIVNFLSLVEAVDRNESVYEKDAGEKEKIFRFDKFVLLKSIELTGPPIFRLKENPRLILVRQDLVDRFAKANWTGHQFVNVREYATYPTPQ